MSNASDKSTNAPAPTPTWKPSPPEMELEPIPLPDQSDGSDTEQTERPPARSGQSDNAGKPDKDRAS
ncbi:hypothetical protein JNB88_27540 [Rhizobium cauense]|uniref:hypothetical protein n=1 Tax=Rhizobium cauense TaxID=1166683 RepID=UPI001C6F1E66|nr:hypothetical protein [Rhizobium cauense]MBW9117378.1 hypothetical protein [Rhizobium cauense]